MKSTITKLLTELGCAKYRWVRRYIGGKWVKRFSNTPWIQISHRLRFEPFNEEDWDFIKWYQKVLDIEQSRDIFWIGDEDKYREYYDAGMSPSDAVDDYLKKF